VPRLVINRVRPWITASVIDEAIANGEPPASIVGRIASPDARIAANERADTDGKIAIPRSETVSPI